MLDRLLLQISNLAVPMHALSVTVRVGNPNVPPCIVFADLPAGNSGAVREKTAAATDAYLRAVRRRVDWRICLSTGHVLTWQFELLV